jgi:hypothetical protein
MNSREEKADRKYILTGGAENSSSTRPSCSILISNNWSSRIDFASSVPPAIYLPVSLHPIISTEALHTLPEPA